MQKSFYLSPKWTLPPHDARGIAIGNVIIHPSDPHPPLLSASAHDLVDPPMSHTQHEATWSLQKARAGFYGVYTKFLEIVLGVGVDASFGRAKETRIDFSFKKMVTEESQLTKQYIDSCMKHPDVVNYLDSMSIRKAVYVVTGIKHVSGAAANFFWQSHTQTKLGLGADATAAGFPLSAGVKVAPENSRTEKASWKNADDFVFAFSVSRIEVNRKGEVTSTKPWRKGAMLDDSNSWEEDKPEYVYTICEPGEGDMLVTEGEEEVLVTFAKPFYTQ